MFRFVFSFGNYPHFELNVEHMDEHFNPSTIHQIQQNFLIINSLCFITSILSRLYKFVGNSNRDVIRSEMELHSTYLEFGNRENK